MPNHSLSRKKMNQIARLSEGAVVPNGKEETCWVFKRVLNSTLERHLIYKVIYLKTLDYSKRGGWRLYTGPESIDNYVAELDHNNGWGNPWSK